MPSRWSTGRFTPRCSGCSKKAGFRADGVFPKTINEPSTTASPRRGDANCSPRPRAGSDSCGQSAACCGRRNNAMGWKRQIVKFWGSFGRRRRARELREEFSSHLAMEEQESLESGMTPEEAHYAALRQFGNVTLAQERSRQIWGWNFPETLLQDVRYGLRQLRRSPGFTAVAVLTLALGIGANTAIFTLVNALLLRSLPVEKPDELVLLGHGLDRGVVGEAQRGSWELFSYAFYQHLRDDNRVFQEVCAFQSFEEGESVRAGSTVTSAPGRLVSGNYFSVLGVRPFLGRTLTPEDDTAEAAPAAVISYRFWSKQFSEDATALGKTLTVNGVAFTIVGVAPPGFFGETLQSDPPDMWLPLSTQPQVMQQESLLTPQGPYWLDIIGRLKPHTTLQQAQANVSALLRGFLDEEVRNQVSAERWRAIKNSFIVLTPGGRGISELRENL